VLNNSLAGYPASVQNPEPDRRFFIGPLQNRFFAFPCGLKAWDFRAEALNSENVIDKDNTATGGIPVRDNQRYQRLRLLIKKLNAQRKKQAKKIDILCNDFLTAHRRFIKTLVRINFEADFYESLLGITELDELFHKAARLIESYLHDTNTALFLCEPDGFQLYLRQSSPVVGLTRDKLEDYFSPELVRHLCRLDQICTLDEVCALHNIENVPKAANDISGVIIPLRKKYVV